MTMITPSYLGETIEYSSLHACRSTLEDPTLMNSGGQHRRRAGYGCMVFVCVAVWCAHTSSSLVDVVASSRRWPYIQRCGLICDSQSCAVGMRPKSSLTCCSPT